MTFVLLSLPLFSASLAPHSLSFAALLNEFIARCKTYTAGTLEPGVRVASPMSTLKSC